MSYMYFNLGSLFSIYFKATMNLEKFLEGEFENYTQLAVSQVLNHTDTDTHQGMKDCHTCIYFR